MAQKIDWNKLIPKIKKLLASQVSKAEIARRLGLHESTLRGGIKRHLKAEDPPPKAPKTYSDGDIEYIYMSVANGRSLRYIAWCLKVPWGSFSRHKVEIPEIENAIADGKARLASEIREALIKEAKGYNVEVREFTKEGKKITKYKRSNRWMRPNIQAAEILLKDTDQTDDKGGVVFLDDI